MTSILEHSTWRSPVGDIADNVLDILESARIELKEDIQEPPICLEVIGRDYNTGIATLGNFSLLKGKAKSRKTFATTIFMASVVRNSEIMGKVGGILPIGKSTILYFDTEQSSFHTQRMATRVTKLAEIEDPENFKVYSLRRFPPAQRLQLIEYAIHNIRGIGFVVIDGIRDLVTSINDEDQATTICSKLLKWTEEHNIHILVILHENKGNEFARGHLGSELVNKAETVLTVTKSPDNEKVSIIEAEFCRDREPEPFAFSIDENGLPYIVNWQLPDKKKSITPRSISLTDHKRILHLAFSENNKMKYKELVAAIKYACGKTGWEIGDNKAKDFITWYNKENHISKHGTDNSRVTFYSLNWVDLADPV
jgi:hypothetical protein